MNNIWLYLGPEIGDKQKATHELITNITKKLSVDNEKESLEKLKWYANDTDIKHISSEIQSNSLFSQYRFIHITQIDSWSASDVKLFLQAINTIADDTYILLTSDETKVIPTLEKSVPSSHKKIFWELQASEYIARLTKMSQEKGMQFQDDAIELMVYLAGENTSELETLFSQITTFLEAQAPPPATHPNKESTDTTTQEHYIVTRENIEHWLTHIKHETVFSLFDAMANSKYEEVFSTLGILLKSGEAPAKIMAGLIYQIKIALRLTEKTAQGESITNALYAMSIRGRIRQQKYINFLGKCNAHAIQQMFRQCVQTEQLLRSGGTHKYFEVTISQLIFRICMLHNNPHYNVSTGNINSYYNKNITHI